MVSVRRQPLARAPGASLNQTPGWEQIVIDGYMAALRRELRGPWLLRASMLREVRDGLRDAAAAHREAGLVPGEAERRAVDEFGPVRLVADQLRIELAASTGRYTAAIVVLTSTAQMVLAHHVWQAAADRASWQSPAPAYRVFADVIDVSNVVLLVAAASAVLALGPGGRILPTRRVVRVVAVATLAMLGVHIVSGSILTVFSPMGASGWSSAHQLWMAVMSALPSAWIGCLARRCLWLTSVRRAGSEDVADDATHLVPGPSFRG